MFNYLLRKSLFISILFFTIFCGITYATEIKITDNTIVGLENPVIGEEPVFEIQETDF